MNKKPEPLLQLFRDAMDWGRSYGQRLNLTPELLDDVAAQFADKARAAVEADRVQRVPHPVCLSARALIDAARRDWPSSSVHRARVLEAANALESALLAYTPAQPAQQEPSKPVHWSDCATNSAPAYPPGACDCMPTPDMCRAAVEYINGPGVYEKLPRGVLDIEEEIYRQVWLAMQAVAHQEPPQPSDCWCEACDLAQGNPLGRTRMSLCPECGDKRCPRAKHHDAPCNGIRE